MGTYEKFVIGALREAMLRPYGFTDLHDKKYGIPPPDPTFDAIFNPPPPPEPTLQQYLDHRERQERAKFEAVWEDAISLIRAKRFRTRAALAAYYQQPPHWACELVRLLVDQRVFSSAEMRELLPGRAKKKTGKPKASGKPKTVVRLDRMTRLDVERVLYARDPELSLPLFVQMIRSRCFRSKTGLAAHVFKPAYWTQAFSRFLERNGIMSKAEFDGSFSDRRGRSGVSRSQAVSQQSVSSQSTQPQPTKREGIHNVHIQSRRERASR
jgi:hypothetical protein